MGQLNSLMWAENVHLLYFSQSSMVLQDSGERKSFQWAELGVVSLVIHFVELGPRQTKIGRQKKGSLEYIMQMDLGKAQSLWIIVHLILMSDRDIKPLSQKRYSTARWKRWPILLMSVSSFLSQHNVCATGRWTDCPWWLRWNCAWTQQCGFPLPMAD